MQSHSTTPDGDTGHVRDPTHRKGVCKTEQVGYSTVYDVAGGPDDGAGKIPGDGSGG